jgi:CheY-like chemotaxis protein
MNLRSSTEKFSIFLAEDDHDDVYLFHNALGRMEVNHQLKVFGNGLELMQSLEDMTAALPDLIFIDINMPVKNGLDALREIRQQHSAKLPVFLFSTTEDRVTVEQARKLGATGYLSKPKSIRDLEDLLIKVLSVNWQSRSIHDFYVHLQAIDLAQKV